MASPDRTTHLEAKINTLRVLVVRILQLATVAMLAGVFAVPLATITPDDSDDPVSRLGFLGLFDLITQDAERFLDADDRSGDNPYPYSLSGGILLTRIGLAVLTVAIVATAVACLAVLDSGQRRDKAMVRAAAAALGVGTLLVAVGLAWIPEYRDDGVGPGWGLWLPLFVAVWVLVGHTHASDLDG